MQIAHPDGSWKSYVPHTNQYNYHTSFGMYAVSLSHKHRWYWVQFWKRNSGNVQNICEAEIPKGGFLIREAEKAVIAHALAYGGAEHIE